MRDLSPSQLSGRAIGAWLVIGFGLWAGAVTATLDSAHEQLQSGRRSFETLRSFAESDSADIDGALGLATSGAESFDAAESDLSRPVLMPLHVLPVIGRQLRSAQAIAGFAATSTGSVTQIAAHGSTVARGSDGTGLDVVMSAIAEELRRLDHHLGTADLGPRDGLLEPLADARDEAARLVGDYGPIVHQAHAAAVGLADFLDGSDYLLIGANNAEMQIGAGMVLSIGELSVEGARIQLTEIESTKELFPVPPNALVDGDVEEHWGFLSPTNDFRKLGVSARFDQYVAPQALAMWRAETGRELDGVVLVDAVLLSRLVSVIGEVEIDGVLFDAEMVERYLLYEQYEQFGIDEAGLDARRDRLSQIAAAVFVSLTSKPLDPLELFSVLRRMSVGRHVMAYGVDGVQQAGWSALDVDGALEGDEMGVYLMNVGASKLDPLMAVDVVADVNSGPQSTQIRIDIEMRNSVGDPSVLPPYVAGPWDSIGLESRGTYLGRLVVYLPGSSTDARFVGDVPLEVFGLDGNVLVLGTRVLIPPGGVHRITLEASLPPTLPSVRLSPSARVPPVQWTVNDSRFDDTEQRVVLLGE